MQWIYYNSCFFLAITICNCEHYIINCLCISTYISSGILWMRKRNNFVVKTVTVSYVYVCPSVRSSARRLVESQNKASPNKTKQNCLMHICVHPFAPVSKSLTSATFIVNNKKLLLLFFLRMNRVFPFLILLTNNIYFCLKQRKWSTPSPWCWIVPMEIAGITQAAANDNQSFSLTKYTSISSLVREKSVVDINS